MYSILRIHTQHLTRVQIACQDITHGYMYRFARLCCLRWWAVRRDVHLNRREAWEIRPRTELIWGFNGNEAILAQAQEADG